MIDAKDATIVASFERITRLGNLLVAADWNVQHDPSLANQAAQQAALTAYEEAVWENTHA